MGVYLSKIKAAPGGGFIYSEFSSRLYANTPRIAMTAIINPLHYPSDRPQPVPQSLSPIREDLFHNHPPWSQCLICLFPMFDPA